jgi:hypothetical protein
VDFGGRKSKDMVCKFCGESRNFLFYVYDDKIGSDLLVCAVHWNKLYFEELEDQLVQNDELKEI